MSLRSTSLLGRPTGCTFWYGTECAVGPSAVGDNVAVPQTSEGPSIGTPSDHNLLLPITVHNVRSPSTPSDLHALLRNKLGSEQAVSLICSVYVWSIRGRIVAFCSACTGTQHEAKTQNSAPNGK
jgi:hypothetical protein